MKSIYKTEMQRAFQNRFFWISLALAVAIAVWHFFDAGIQLAQFVQKVYTGEYSREMMISKTGYAASSVEIWMGIRSGASQYLYFFIMPLICAIPYGASFCLDIKSGYVNQLVSRVSRKTYFKAKMLAVFASGAVLAAVPLIVNLVICMCAIPNAMPVVTTKLFEVTANSLLAGIFYEHTWLYVLIYIGFAAVFFGLMNMLCLVISFYEENRFMVVMTPLIMYYGIHVLMQWGMQDTRYSPFYFVVFCRCTQANLPAVAVTFGILLMLPFYFISRCDKDIL